MSTGNGSKASKPEASFILIQEAAYLRWERRGRPQNTEMEDWLQAEAEILGAFAGVLKGEADGGTAASGASAPEPARGRGKTAKKRG